MLDLKKSRVELDRQFIAIFSSLVLVFITFFWNLGTLTRGLSPVEVATRVHSQNLHQIGADPINAPYSALQYLVHLAGLHTVFYLRLVSVILALVFVISFFKIARHWFGKPIALTSTIILMVTPLVVLTARSASANIMFLSPALVAAYYFWYSRMDSPTYLAYLGMIIITALVVYTPGLIWLLILSLYFIRANLLPMARYFSVKKNILAFLVAVATLTPLFIGLFNHPHYLRDLFLIPASLPHLHIFKDLMWATFGIGWHSSAHSIFQIDNLPLLNAAQAILAIFGCYALWSRARETLLGLLGVIGLSLIGVTLIGDYSLMLVSLVPLMILASGGLRYLYIEWRGVFPRNPLPRGLALGLVCLTVVACINYGLRYSLLAWPETVSTRSTYVLK